MHRIVLGPLDESPLAAFAVPVAAALARRMHAGLLLLNASACGDRGAMATAEAYLARQATHARAAGLAVETRVLHGNIVDAIAAEAERHSIAAIVLVTHGHALLGRGAGGSVADDLLARLEVPILLLRPWHTAGACRYLGPGTPIIVPLDGSAAAEAALLPARELAGALGGLLTLVRVVRPQGPLGRSAARPVPGGPVPYRPCRDRDVARAYLDRLVLQLHMRGQPGAPWAMSIAVRMRARVPSRSQRA